ncbi:MAG: hypothetical protein HY706_22050 [Candidatus Hydrogenedentes bacterium]|nr:hypothetical protein [Candidatus Hydrogenedentota bacterium]
MARSMIGLTLMAILLTACETFPWPRKKASTEPVAEMETVDMSAGTQAPPVPEPGLPLASEQRFSDVPLPVGVKEDLARSYVFESATLQIGRMVYSTKASVNELAQFYIRECPATDWKLDNVIQAEGADLTFKKSGKRLHVTVRDQGMTRGRELILNLTPDSGP